MPSLRISILSGERAGEEFEPDRDLVVIGSAPAAQLALSGLELSPEHCRIVVGHDSVWIEDLGSEHGTFVVRASKESRIPEGAGAACRLASGDMIRLGSDETNAVRLQVTIQRDDEPAHVVSVRPISELTAHTTSNERNAELLEVLARVHARLGVTSDLDEALAVVAEAALELVPRATHATLILGEKQADDAAFIPVLTRVRDRDGRVVTPNGEVKVTRSVFRKVLRERAAVLAADAASEAFSSESLLGANIKSTIGVPLWRGTLILGVLQVDNRDRPALFDTTDLEVLGILTTNASLTLHNARLIRELTSAQEQLSQENQYLKSKSRSKGSANVIVGRSRALSDLMTQLRKVADTRVTVLIQGETGTGKELIAAALHQNSRRSSHLFVAQNCAALPGELLESELFGHRRGAFTGATEDKRGLFDLADRGTLFLDEVSELPLPLQAKLLRVLQEREMRPLGASQDKRVDVRVVAACNRDLEAEVRAGRFREDLFYRLSVFPLKVPPLRERRDDIALLAGHFLERYAREYNNPVLGLSQEALDQMTRYDWPGNVRELENEVQRLVIQAEPGSHVPAALLSQKIRGSLAQHPALASSQGTLRQKVEQFERQLVLAALDRHGNNKTKAAKNLGITREGLHKKLKQLGID